MCRRLRLPLCCRRARPQPSPPRPRTITAMLKGLPAPCVGAWWRHLTLRVSRLVGGDARKKHQVRLRFWARQARRAACAFFCIRVFFFYNALTPPLCFLPNGAVVWRILVCDTNGARHACAAVIVCCSPSSSTAAWAASPGAVSIGMVDGSLQRTVEGAGAVVVALLTSLYREAHADDLSRVRRQARAR